MREVARETDRTIELKVVSDAAAAGAIAAHGLAPYAPNDSLAMYGSAFAVLRPERSWAAGQSRGHEKGHPKVPVPRRASCVQ